MVAPPRDAAKQKTPLETQALLSFPIVEVGDFAPFLRACGDGQDVFRNNHAKHKISRDTSSKTNSSVNNSIGNSLNSSYGIKETCGVLMNDYVAKCFSFVPAAFFDDTFDLTAKSTFESVILLKSLGNYDKVFYFSVIILLIIISWSGFWILWKSAY